MRRDEDGVGFEARDDLAQPGGEPRAKARVGDTRRPLVRRVVGRVVGDPDHPEAEAVRLEHDRPSRFRDVASRSDRRDARGVKGIEGVDERDRPVVEGVVVGQRHAVDAEACEHVHGGRRCTEEERLPGIRPALAARRDAALEVQHDQVGLPHGRDDLRGEQRCVRRRLERPADLAAEHRVAGERHRDAASFRHPVILIVSPDVCLRPSCAEPEPPRARTTGDDDPHGRS